MTLVVIFAEREHSDQMDADFQAVKKNRILKFEKKSPKNVPKNVKVATNPLLFIFH